MVDGLPCLFSLYKIFIFFLSVEYNFNQTCLISLKKSFLRNRQNIYRHLGDVWALRLRRRIVGLFLLVFSLCDAEMKRYAGEVQYVFLSKALIFSACTSISFEFLYDVSLDPITFPMHPPKALLFSARASGHFQALQWGCLTTKNIRQLCFKMQFSTVRLVCIKPHST